MRDACLERLRSFRQQRLQFVEARPGSLTVFAIVTGVSIFVLDRTVGEALKDEFKQTDSYRKLRELFRLRIDVKALHIAEGVRRVFASKAREVQVKALPRSAETKVPNTIVVEVSPEEVRPGREPVRTLGEELD